MNASVCQSYVGLRLSGRQRAVVPEYQFVGNDAFVLHQLSYGGRTDTQIMQCAVGSNTAGPGILASIDRLEAHGLIRLNWGGLGRRLVLTPTGRKAADRVASLRSPRAWDIIIGGFFGRWPK